MTLKDAIKSSLTILKQVMEEKLNATNIEVWFFYFIHICIQGCFRQLFLSIVVFAAGNSRAWKDLPHVFKRRAGGRNQGYLKQKRLGVVGSHQHIVSIAFRFFLGLHMRFLSVMCKFLLLSVSVLLSVQQHDRHLDLGVKCRDVYGGDIFCYDSVLKLKRIQTNVWLSIYFFGLSYNRCNDGSFKGYCWWISRTF